MLLEAGFDELDGISWTKGCYMGQELTARGRAIAACSSAGFCRSNPVPPCRAHGTPISADLAERNEREVGEMRSSLGARAGWRCCVLDAPGRRAAARRRVGWPSRRAYPTG